MSFDYSKLKGRIREFNLSQSEFAERIGLTEVAVNQKLNNKSQWRQQEIDKAVVVLEIPKEEISAYFFTIET